MKRLSDVVTWYDTKTQLFNCCVTVQCTYDEVQQIDDNIMRLLKVNPDDVINDKGEFRSEEDTNNGKN